MTFAIKIFISGLFLMSFIAKAGAPKKSLRPIPRKGETQTSRPGGHQKATIAATNTSYPPAVNARKVELPICINNKLPQDFYGMNALDYIEHKFETGNKAGKYQGYTTVYERLAIDDVEAMTRLVYGEMLAMGPKPECLTPNNLQLGAQNIAAVIQNRVRRRGGNIKKTIWQWQQFNSTNHQYTNNRWGGSSHYRDMLCPKNREAWSLAVHFVNGYRNGHIPIAISKKADNYYMCNHFDWNKIPTEDRAKFRSKCDPWGYNPITQDRDGNRFPESFTECLMTYYP